LVILQPIWIAVFTREFFNACESVLAQMKSTPSMPHSIM
jgi:hypothetical protein